MSEIDDLMLELRGLTLVRNLLVERGVDGADIAAHSRELERVRVRLAELILEPDAAALRDAA